MNIAFSAIIIFWVVLPGIVMRYWYRKGSWESPVTFASAAEEIAYGLLLALVLHTAAVGIVRACGIQPDLDAAFYLMMGRAPTDAALEGAVQAVTHHVGAVFTYFIVLNAAAFLIGRSLHGFVRVSHLDKTTRLFQFDNKWYYLLAGEMDILERCDVPAGAMPSKEDIDALLDRETIVIVSAVVEEAGAAYLYWGVLFRYYFDRRGRLSELVLSVTFRRMLDDDEPSANTAMTEDASTTTPTIPTFQDRHDDPRYYHIRGDYFTIRFENIKTLNVDYAHIYKD